MPKDNDGKILCPSCGYRKDVAHVNPALWGHPAFRPCELTRDRLTALMPVLIKATIENPDRLSDEEVELLHRAIGLKLPVINVPEVEQLYEARQARMTVTRQAHLSATSVTSA